MKVRSGFVSNSSSSSFIAVAVPATAWRPKVDTEKWVGKNVTQRQLDAYAAEYFDTDSDYEAFRKGAEFPEFYAWVYKKVNAERGESNELPEDYSNMTYEDVDYIFRQAGESVEYGTIEIPANVVAETIAKVQKDFPDAEVKVFLRHCE